MANDRHTNYFVHSLLRARDWQHRPEFDQVCAWWRKSSMGPRPVQSAAGQGVCALVGMGGAGKTAIADRFLNELLDNTSTTRQRVSPPLPPPNSVFVYSFYDDDKPENFFRHLQIWLEGTSAPDKQKSPTQLMFDIQQHHGLIILDGLERVQESGARGGFGRLTSPSLRDLLNHIASGSARELSVLVTSRFPLTDLRDSQPRFFHTILVDQIDVAAGVALLRDRGVRGTDVQLAPIVEHCGQHALTVDLAGGYIKEYGHGDPSTPLNLGTAEELQAEAEQEPDDDKRAVLIQSRRFSRIAQRYREAMLDSDEAALALLERICLFRLGVDCETLAAIFTGPAAEKVSGKALASLNADQLQKKLDWLVRMRIVEANKTRASGQEYRIQYSIHPAVRDGFQKFLNSEAVSDAHQEIRRHLHERAASGNLLVLDPNAEDKLVYDPRAEDILLFTVPGETKPSEPAMLDLLEEIVHHSIASGFVDEAWQIYENRLGGLDNLGWRLGEFSRGQRICEQFTRGSLSEVLSFRDEIQLCSDHAFYLRALGDLRRVSLLLARSINLARDSADAHAETMGCLDLAKTLWLRGRLGDARAAIGPAFRLPCEDVAQVWSHSPLYAARGYLHLLSGAVANAREGFGESFRLQQRFYDTDKKEFAYCEEGVWTSMFHLRLGRMHDVNDGCKSNLLLMRAQCRTDSSLYAPLCQLVLASLATRQGHFCHAVETLTSAYNWALQRNDKELQCWSAVVQAAIDLSAIISSQPAKPQKHTAQFAAANTSIAEGLKIARDCGYGLYHIDLLLERARLHLLRGDAGAALDDIEVALDTGIPANEETGQVELLAANHEECGYAWAIPPGLQLRAEALLLQAAREVIAVGWALPTEEGTLNPIDVAVVGSAHPTIGQLIGDAKRCLNEALDRWHDLRDPEPTEDNNFKLDGKEYNYRAAETHQVLVQLEGGILSRYPLACDSPNPASIQKPDGKAAHPRKIFISYAREDEAIKNRLTKTLRTFPDLEEAAWDDSQIESGQQWREVIERAIADSQHAICLLSTDFLGSKFIQSTELPLLLAARDDGKLSLHWVLVKPCNFKNHPVFAETNAILPAGRPLAGMDEKTELEAALVEICVKLEAARN